MILDVRILEWRLTPLLHLIRDPMQRTNASNTDRNLSERFSKPTGQDLET